MECAHEVRCGGYSTTCHRTGICEDVADRWALNSIEFPALKERASDSGTNFPDFLEHYLHRKSHPRKSLLPALDPETAAEGTERAARASQQTPRFFHL